MPKFNLLTDIPSLSNRVAIVTGGNRGMGFQIVQQLANHGAKVYMASRSKSAALKAIDLIESQNPELKGKERIIHLSLDLASLKNTKNAAQQYLQSESRLDILINNAAVMSHYYGKTAEGLEDSFAINHLGHFVFTRELLPVLIATSKLPGGDVRVLTVSSDIHRIAPAGGMFSDVEQVNDYLTSSMFKNFIWGRYFRYARSKLANILFAKRLQQEFDFKVTPILSIATNPGGVATETVLQNMRSVFLIGPIMLWMVKRRAVKPLDGVVSILFAATAPEVREDASKYAGAFVSPDAEIQLKRSNDSQSDELAENLWSVSKEISESILAE